MNKKGFTLIELIGTIVILSLTLLILIPNVTRSIKSGTTKADEQTKTSIELAAKNWASDHKGDLPKNKDGSKIVAVTELQSQGYLDDDLKLPSTSASINSACVKITKTNDDEVTAKTGKKAYSYEYLDAC